MVVKKLLAISLITLSVAGCGINKDQGTALGAVSGAVVGAHFGSGTGHYLGAAIGGVAGALLGRNLADDE